MILFSRPSSDAVTFKRFLWCRFAEMLRRPRLRSSSRSLVRALRAPEGIRQRLPVTGPFTFDLYGQRISYIAGLQDGVGRALFWADGASYEPETMSVLIQELSGARTFLDIGANTGFYSLAAASMEPKIRIHAFEPVPVIAAALRRNIAANGFCDRVVIRQLAIAAHSARLPMHVPEETWGNATLSIDGFRGLTGHVEEVQCMTLDEYAATHGLDDIDVLKVDVEGQEHEVLRGAQCVLAEQRPVVLSECLPEADLAALDVLITEHRYRPFHLRSDGPHAAVRMRPDTTERYKNYLLVPCERDERPWLPHH